MFKAVLSILAMTLLMSQAAMANRLLEPVLSRPFATEIEFPQACDQKIAEAVMHVTRDLEGEAPGGVFKGRAYKINVRGFIYKGGDTVFEATRYLAQGGIGSIVADVRGDYQILNGRCKVSNLRVVKTYKIYESY